MKADYHRYIAEVSTGDAKAMAANSAEAAYAEAAAAAAVVGLAATHPISLGLALGYSAFWYEVQSKPEDACKMVSTVLENATAEWDNMLEDWREDSTLYMQLLRANLALWDVVDAEDCKGEDVDMNQVLVLEAAQVKEIVRAEKKAKKK